MTGIDLEARVAAYLDLRRALGMKMDVDSRVLGDFVRFTRDRGATEAIGRSLLSTAATRAIAIRIRRVSAPKSSCGARARQSELDSRNLVAVS